MCLNSRSSLFFPFHTRSVVPSCASAHWFFCTLVCISILFFDHKKPSRPPGLVMIRAQPLHCSWCFMKPYQRTALEGSAQGLALGAAGLQPVLGTSCLGDRAGCWSSGWLIVCQRQKICIRSKMHFSWNNTCDLDD